MILNYILTLRGHQAFYTMRKNLTEDLWFSLFLIKEDQPDLNYYGGSLISSSAAKLGLGVKLKKLASFVFCNLLVFHILHQVLTDGPMLVPQWMEPMVMSWFS